AVFLERGAALPRIAGDPARGLAPCGRLRLPARGAGGLYVMARGAAGKGRGAGTAAVPRKRRAGDLCSGRGQRPGILGTQQPRRRGTHRRRAGKGRHRMTDVSIGDYTVSNAAPFTLIAGPCQIESMDHARMLAERIAAAAEAAGVNWIFKASYDKANRSSLSGKRGIGMEEGLRVLSTIRSEFDVPVLTDVHAPDQCATVASAVDVLQIPA
ncbi:unnamed protein product, partial [Laminaria digitata]